MKRGEIYYVLPAGMTSGHEIRSGRPAVIVSNDILNATSDVVEICFMTTQPKRPMPTHVVTKASGMNSTILAEQINAVSTSRVGEFIGVLNDDDLMRLDKALTASLGISCAEPNPHPMLPPSPNWKRNAMPTRDSLRISWQNSSQEASSEHSAVAVRDAGHHRRT